MISLNNKGQSLVLFVLIVPILFLILVLVFDVGNALIEKQELDNISYLTIEYGLEHMDEFSIETKMKNIVTKNNNKIENINIVINDDKIILTEVDNELFFQDSSTREEFERLKAYKKEHEEKLNN